MNIAIIEYKNDIDEALKYFSPEGSLYLSVSAEASYWLAKRNIKFLTDESVLMPEEFKAVGDENFEIVEKWIEALEKTLQSKNPIFEKRKFFPFRWNFYRLKILLDAVRTKSALLERLIERENPSLIGAPPGGKPGVIHDHRFSFHKYDSLYGILAERLGTKNGSEVKTWKMVKPGAEKLLKFEDIKNYLKILIKKYLRATARIANLFKDMQKKDNILLGNLYYDIAPIVQKFSHKFNFYFYKNPVYINSLSSIFKLRPKEKTYKFPKIDLKGLFKTANVTGDPVMDKILGERVQKYAEKFVPFLWKGLNYVESLDRQMDFRAYICHVGSHDSFYGLPVHYFGRKNKPVFIIQHGAYGLALNRQTEFCDFGHDGYFFGWGDGISRMYESRKKGKCKIISTGSSLIEGIRKKSKPRKNISKVCYIPSMYRGYNAHYPNGQPCLDSELFIMETNFLSALKPYSGKYQITYKVCPSAVRTSPLFGKNPMLSWVKENIPEMKIESRPLLSVIDKFDLFIIDWPSTTLIQACATGAEVMVYAGNKYQVLTTEAMELLKKRAIVVKEKEDFKDMLKQVLETGEVISDTRNTAFLEQYGIYKPDGKSLERMVTEIEYISKKGKRDKDAKK